MKGRVLSVAAASIRVDGGTQVRSEINPDVVDDYAARLRAGDRFPPPVVFNDGENDWLADGFHRLAANAKEKRETIDVDRRLGTLDDARWFAAGANKDHGLRRSNEDKRNAVSTALSLRSNASDRAIADHCGVSHPFVSEIRRQIGASCEKRMGSDGRARALPASKEAEPEASSRPVVIVDPSSHREARERRAELMRQLRVLRSRAQIQEGGRADEAASIEQRISAIDGWIDGYKNRARTAIASMARTPSDLKVQLLAKCHQALERLHERRHLHAAEVELLTQIEGALLHASPDLAKAVGADAKRKPPRPISASSHAAAKFGDG